MSIALTFILFLVFFTVVGMYAAAKQQNTTTDGLGILLILRCFDLPISTIDAIAIMLAGVAGSVIWKSGLQLSDAVYEVLPGMAASFLVYLIFLVIKKISHPNKKTN
ncbi:MAG: hypothetical protein ACRC1Z_09180 [Waterburya sp.]